MKRVKRATASCCSASSNGRRKHRRIELERRRDLIASVARQEEERFRETIERGLKILEEEIAHVQSNSGAVLSGAAAFKLHDTYGFPADLTQVIAAERGVAVDLDGYEKALALPHARPMDFTGRPLTGMVYVDTAGYETDAALAKWVQRGVNFVSGLPAKKSVAARPRKRLAKR